MHIILQDFKGSPNGYDVIEYKKGDEVELPASLVDVALENKWAKAKKPAAPAKAKPAAPAEVAAQKPAEELPAEEKPAEEQAPAPEQQ